MAANGDAGTVPSRRIKGTQCFRVWEIQVDGPHVEEWPPKGHDTLYGELRSAEI